VKKCLILLLIGIACFAGCKKEPPPPPPPKDLPPPEPTPEQVAAEVRNVLGPMMALTQTDASHAGFGNDGKGGAGVLTDDIKNQVVAGLKQAKQTHGFKENGKQGLAIVSHELETLISEARDQERWKLVLGAIEAYDVLVPNASKMTRLKERATLHMTRPLVRLRGFFHDQQTDDIYAFLTVETRPDKVSHDVRARKGDEFFDVRLVDIVGDKDGVLLEYLKIPGNTWKVRKEQ
jgi:hypothetical protein